MKLYFGLTFVRFQDLGLQRRWIIAAGMPSLISQISQSSSTLNSQNAAEPYWSTVDHLIITLKTLSLLNKFSRSPYELGDSSCSVKHDLTDTQFLHIVFIWQNRDKSSHFSIASQQYQLMAEKSAERAAFTSARSDFSGMHFSEKHVHLRKWLLWGHRPDVKKRSLIRVMLAATRMWALLNDWTEQCGLRAANL